MHQISTPRTFSLLRKATLAGAALLIAASPGSSAGQEPESPSEKQVLPAEQTTDAGPRDLAPPPREIRNALLLGQTDEALRLLGEAIQESPEFTARWKFYTGIALFDAERWEAAEKEFAQLAEGHPKSVWVPKALFRRAEACRQLRRYDEAERIYREALRHLRSPERQSELAEVYMSLAALLSKPADLNRPDSSEPRYIEALPLYANVLEMECTQDVHLQAHMELGRCYVGLKQHTNAALQYKKTLDLELPDSEPIRWDAARQLGEQEFAAGQFQLARRSMEDLVAHANACLLDNKVEGSALASMRTAQAKAQRIIGDTWHATRRLPLAISAWEKRLETHPEHPENGDILHFMANALGAAGRTDEALVVWDRLIQRKPTGELTTPTSTQLAEKQKRSALFFKANALAQASRRSEAIGVYQEYVRMYPDGEHWTDSQRRIIDLEYDLAVELAKEERWPEARTAIETFVATHPLDSRNPSLLFDLGETFAEQARKANPVRESLLRQAVDHWDQLARTMPNSDTESRARLAIARVLENDLQEMDAAVAAYKAVQGPYQSDAQTTLAQLQKSELAMETGRITRSHETVSVQVQIRNVKELQVQIHALDLEAYYRKSHSYRNVEDLDLDLITPDSEFVYQVDGFEAYAPLQRTIELPVSGPGVWAIAVSSPTQRATTLVVQSDLDMVVKSSSQEIFVYAQDMQTNAPAAKVRLLFAITEGGDPVIREATTDATGVARWTAPENKLIHGGVQVLAMRGGHFSACNLSTKGLNLGQPLPNRSLVYSERPAYRPGETIHWKGIARIASKGLWVLPNQANRDIETEPGNESNDGSGKNAGGGLSLVDPNGKVFAQNKAIFGPFGTCHGSIDLPQNAPVGVWTLRLEADSIQTAIAQIKVETFRVPTTEVLLETEKQVVWRGEIIQVTARAQTTYGAPMVDTLVRWNLPGGRMEEARTDTEGIARVQVETQQVVSNHTLVIQATLPEENVGQSLAVFVATTGFEANLTTERDLELVGSSFPVTLTAKAPDGSGISKRMRFTAVKRTKAPGKRWTEKILIERSVQTDEQGTVRFPIALQESGFIILRIAGTDQFDQTIEASIGLTIAGEDDSEKLRLLTKETELSVGQTIEVSAVNRALPGTALLTIETDRVAEYRMVRLGAGVTPIPITLQAVHAPNVRVALSYMDQHRFHKASTSLALVQTLQVEILGATEPIEAGTSGEVTLRATDSQGNPVKTEFSLAIIDEALYQLYKETTPKLNAHFALSPRKFPTLRTQTSCTFSYQGKTTAIASAILAEVARVDEEQKWAAAKQSLKSRLEGPAAMGPAADQFHLGSSADMETELDSLNEAISLGGGAGGKFGARMGGRKNLRAQGGANLEEPSGPPDNPTALWRAEVVTDADGKAVVSLDWPTRSTRWRLTAHGVGEDNHFGSATTVRTAKRDFFVELLGPALVMEGDRPQWTARIHDSTQATGRVQLRLQVEHLGAPFEQVAEIDLEGRSKVDFLFDKLPAIKPGKSLQAVLTASLVRNGTTLEASAKETMVVKKSGIEVFDTASGVLTDVATLELELAAASRTLEFRVSAGLDAELMQLALGRNPLPNRCLWVLGPAEQASDLLGACAMLKSIERSQGDPQYVALQDRIRGLIATLTAHAHSGGWSWQGKQGAIDPLTSAHVALALATAQQQGWSVDDSLWNRMAEELKKSARQANTNGDDIKASIHHTLAVMKQADFAALNRLHRSRSNLSPAGQAHLALALVAAGRKQLAKEAIQDLDALAQPGHSPQIHRWLPSPALAWYGSSLEVTAWVVLAKQAALGDVGSTKPGIGFLMDQRPWFDRKASGLAVWALAGQTKQAGVTTDAGHVIVRINDGAAQRVPLGQVPTGMDLAIRLDLPDEPDGTASKTRIALQLEGGTSAHYMAVLRGYAPATKTEAVPGFYVRRHMALADLPHYRGKEVPTGFRTVRDVTQWRNTRTQVRKGEVILLELNASRYNTRVVNSAQLADYLELEVPLPAGVSLLEDNQVSQKPYRKVGNSLVFSLGSLRSSFTTKLRLVGRHPGEYVFPPAVIRSAYRPELVYVHETKRLSVLGQGEATTDIYQPTPDELFHLGKAKYEAKDLAAARESLLPYMDAYENKMQAFALVEASRILLYAAIERKDAKETVRFFEIIKERDADLFVPLDQVIQIGDSYSQLGEHERAMLIFRASLEETFGTDLKIVGALNAQDQWLAASRIMNGLVQIYPDLPVVIETDLAIADRLLQLAPNANSRKDLQSANIDRAELTGMGVQRLRRFIAMYSKSPLAPDAGLNLVQAFFDLEDYERTAELSEQLGDHFETPEYKDSYRYSAALARWYMGLDEQALNELLAVSTSTYNDKEGRKVPSANKDLALYIIGQIHHANQEVALASNYYGMVKGLFPDAQMALLSLKAKELKFAEEVFRIRPGQSADLLLEHRNIAEVELLAYPVDLMTLYLRERDLTRVTEVNLAGIAPTLSRSIPLPNTSALRLKKHKAQLALTEPGAYLVMARGGDQHASALVLVSELDVHVQDFDDGQVRVQAFDAGSGKYLRNVDVRVLGTDGGPIEIGKTDPRGLYVAEAIRGRGTIIARLDRQHYAFHLGVREMQAKSRPQRAPNTPTAGKMLYFQNVAGQNEFNMQSRQQDVNSNIQHERKGVQVQRVK